jgi:tetratricopeptide (TPR) repeat protein
VRAIIVAVLACAAVSPSNASAHGSIHEQIRGLSRRIASESSNAGLYLQRGELHRAHRDWRSALTDYDRALALDPGLDVVDLCRGVLLFESGRPRSARVPLDRFLIRHPDHVRARVARARVLVSLGEPLVAVEDFSRAIAQVALPPPEYYIERAGALADADRIDQAIQGLNEGLERLGNVITLQELAISLELRTGRVDDALARLDRAWSVVARQETRWIRRGDILRQAGRSAEAREAYEKGLEAIEDLRPAQRTVRAIVDLERRARTGLAAVRPPSSY